MPKKDAFPGRAEMPAQAMGRVDPSEQYRDLCSNCDNGEACRGRTRPRRPIFFCEEFIVFGAAPAPEPVRALREKPKAMRSTNGFIGLCVNCESIATCTLPKPEGGIWHCEEYQ